MRSDCYKLHISTLGEVPEGRRAATSKYAEFVESFSLFADDALQRNLQGLLSRRTTSGTEHQWTPKNKKDGRINGLKVKGREKKKNAVPQGVLDGKRSAEAPGTYKV